MLKVVHWLKKDKLSKDLEKANFLLCNKKGGYLYLSTKRETKNQGFFINENFSLFKSIENIQINGQITKATNKFSSVTFERDNNAIEHFILPYEHNAFIYELKKYRDDLILDLDCRGAWDKDQWGRYYNVQIEKNRIIISYEKQNDYHLYVVITGKNLNAEKIREWHNVHYPLDNIRKDEPDREIYKAVKLQIKSDTKLVFSTNTNREKAIKEGDYVYRNINKLKRKQDNAMIHKTNIKNKIQRMAYNAALNSLNGLLSEIDNNLGIIRAFPWYYKFWSRDEMYAIKALGKRKEASEIYSRTLWGIRPKGTIPNINPSPENGCVDITGLFYYRYSKRDELKKTILALETNHESKGFVVNKPKQTWMDSIDREGPRIEVQALMLNMYNLIGEKNKELTLKNRVKELFWNGKYLNDGIDDFTIRPNFILAYFFYPDLLTKEEWMKCFNNTLPKLSCSWGGISTLDRNSGLYEPMNTGININSYHSGDSFFFINNIAAMAMLRLNKRHYKDRIKNIVDSSTEEILWNGFLGHHSELSSAKKMESRGCRCEAKAAATYIELLNEF
ncbi:hypothetical protein COV16_06035 [Candidatus Woesearchaeota archaeon CG10_big_fil_rev_8_21_14_0_10_34_8]|jgi:hypothetical protein|nr:MAG: hypothetical protein COV16_06035 [Candidatus Woesearchaeota archaeon CG10_big_fil_rev_8_21_14_0_10_34_8]